MKITVEMTIENGTIKVSEVCRYVAESLLGKLKATSEAVPSIIVNIVENS